MLLYRAERADTAIRPYSVAVGRADTARDAALARVTAPTLSDL